MDTTAGLPPEFHYVGLEWKFTEAMKNFILT